MLKNDSRDCHKTHEDNPSIEVWHQQENGYEFGTDEQKQDGTDYTRYEHYECFHK